ncbi:MAG: hypothetical protein Q9200_000940, partial [Gallowayella weberi]
MFLRLLLLDLLLHLIIPSTLTTPESPLRHPLSPPFFPPARHEPISPITCIRTRIHLSPQLCNPIITPLLDNLVPKTYFQPVTAFGRSPCFVELRKSGGTTAIVVSKEQVAVAALTVLKECENKAGSGWVQLDKEKSFLQHYVAADAAQ